MTLQEALTALFKQAKVTYRIEPEAGRIALSSRRTVHVHHASFKGILESLLSGGRGERRFTYRLVDGVYVIGLTGITLDLKEAEPDTAMKTLFDWAGYDYVYPVSALGSQKVTLAAANLSFEQAFDLIQQKLKPPSPLKVAWHHGVCVLTSDGTGKLTEDDFPTRVTLKSSTVDRLQALSDLFDVCNLNFGIAAPVRESVSLEEDAVSYRIVLDHMLRQSDPPLTYKFENGVFTVVERLPTVDYEETVRPSEAPKTKEDK